MSLYQITDDNNRVKLRVLDNDPLSDYVNASFVKVCIAKYSLLFAERFTHARTKHNIHALYFISYDVQYMYYF